MFTQRYLENYEDKCLVKAAVTISGAWNAKLSSIKLSKFTLCMKVLLDFFKVGLIAHSHEENFTRIIAEKGIDWGIFSNNKFREGHKL